jgi:hypothetical protein
MTPCVHTTTKTASVRHDHSICRLCGLYPRNQVFAIGGATANAGQNPQPVVRILTNRRDDENAS